MELADPRLEVLNFGVSGYGLDQAFLRYITNGVDFQPRIVLICFMSWDIRRMVNTFRPFSYGGGGIPLAKPRFVLEADQLVLLGNPVSTLQGLEGLLRDDLKLFKKLGTHDYFAESSYAGTPGDFLALGRLMKLFVNRVWNGAKKEAILNEGVYNPSSEANRLTTKTPERFNEQVKSNASLPVIVLFPSRIDLERYFTKGETSYTPPWSNILIAKGIPTSIYQCHLKLPSATKGRSRNLYQPTIARKGTSWLLPIFILS